MHDSTAAEASVAAKVFAWAMFLYGFALLPLIALTYWYYWAKAPAIPLVLGSAVLLMWNWRGARYYRAVSPLVASRPVRFGPDFAVVPTPITRILFRHVLEVGAWYTGIGLSYPIFLAEFGLQSAMEVPW